MIQNPTPGKALQYAGEFCFPRLSGTRFEEEAQGTILKIFDSLGLEPKIEQFQADYLLIKLCSRIALLPFGILILLGGIFYYFESPLSALVFFILALFIGLGFALYCQSSPEFLGLKNRFWSKNFYIQIGKEKPEKEILIIAHYDSKSQSFPIWLRILVYYLGGLFSVLASGLGIFLVYKYLTASFFLPLWGWIFIFLALIDFLPIFNRLDNKSPGAVDNAGALGVIFELAEIFKEQFLSRTRLWLVLTGAEELGLLGSRNFVKNHKAELGPNQSWVINLDGLGVDYSISALSRLGFPGKKTDPELNNLIKSIAQEKNLKFKMIRASLGFSTDAYSFLKAGYKAVSLGNINRFIHSSEDSIEHLISVNLDDYVQLLKELIYKIDQAASEKNDKRY